MDDGQMERARQDPLPTADDSFRTLVALMADIVVIADLDGRLIHGNPAATAALGHDAAQLQGLGLPDLYPVSLRAEAATILAEVLAGRRAWCPLPLRGRSGALIPVETRLWRGCWDGSPCLVGLCRGVGRELRLLPICAGCKKVRDDSGAWEQVESYLARRTGTRFSHGVCPDCLRDLYPDYPEARPAD